jgi:hypothetical protein
LSIATFFYYYYIFLLQTQTLVLYCQFQFSCAMPWELCQMQYLMAVEQGECSKYSDWATGWTFQDSNPGRGKRLFSSRYPHCLCGPHSPLFSVGWGGPLFLGVKLQGLQTDHSSPSSSVFKPCTVTASSMFIAL